MLQGAFARSCAGQELRWSGRQRLSSCMKPLPHLGFDPKPRPQASTLQWACHLRRFGMHCFAALACTVALPTVAETPLTAAQLRSYCSAYRADRSSSAGLFCVAYVQGFLDGTMTSTSTAGTRSIIDANHHQSADFCVDRQVPLDRIIAQLVATADFPPSAHSMLASELLVRTLQRSYPCAPTSGLGP